MRPFPRRHRRPASPASRKVRTPPPRPDKIIMPSNQLT
jgi:hypothetical protein